MSDVLKNKIAKKENGLLFYSFAPPKVNTKEQHLLTISGKQINRINDLDIDALILYDIQAESHRTIEKRTFPYINSARAL